VIADPDIRPTSEGFLNSDFKGMPKKVGFPLEAGFLSRIIPSHPFNPFSIADIAIAGHGKCHGFRSEWLFIIFATAIRYISRLLLTHLTLFPDVPWSDIDETLCRTVSHLLLQLSTSAVH
jgi:hypothetical protein